MGSGSEAKQGRNTFQVPGLGHRVSGSDYQERVRVQDPNLNLMLDTCARDLTAETRDLKMFPVTCHLRLPPAT